MNKSDILAFLDKQSIIILSTINVDSAPESRAMINIRNQKIAPHLKDFFKKDSRILAITNTHTDKITQIRENPIASLYMYDQEFKGLLLVGKIHELTDTKTKNALWNDSWKIYYPDGKDGGDFSILEFVPELYKFYSSFSVKKGKVL